MNESIFEINTNIGGSLDSFMRPNGSLFQFVFVVEQANRTKQQTMIHPEH